MTQMFNAVTDRQTDTLSSFCNVLCFAVFTWHTLTCDSISTSSWPELITKCMLNFVVSATARSNTGTGFLDLQVGWLAVIPDCSTKRLAVWFLGSASCYDCSDGVLAVCDLSNSFWYTNTLLVLFTVSNQGTNFAQIYQMFKLSPTIFCHVPYSRPNLPDMSKTVHSIGY